MNNILFYKLIVLYKRVVNIENSKQLVYPFNSKNSG